MVSTEEKEILGSTHSLAGSIFESF